VSWVGVLFVTLLGAQLGMRAWLAGRQIAAVAAHRSTVPEAARAHVALEAHAKAAAYTAARVRLAMAASAVETGTTLALTLGGGIAWMDALVARAQLVQPWHGTLVVVTVLLVLAASRLPVMLWRVFKLEARFDFNRVTPAIFAQDFATRLGLAAAVILPAWGGGLAPPPPEGGGGGGGGGAPGPGAGGPTRGVGRVEAAPR
jgi:STE24 endopeptidase